MKTFWKVFILFSFAFGIHLGCSQFSSSPSATAIRVQLYNEPFSLDPTLAEDGVSLIVLNALFDGLVGYDAESRLQLRLAENYTVSPDGKKYTFSLRKNIQWSDGQPIRAEHFVLAIQRALSSQVPSKLAHYFMHLQGAKEFHSGKVSAEKLGVHAIGEKLVFDLDHRSSAFIHALTLPAAFPLRKDVLEAHQGAWPADGPTSGAYRIRSRKVDQNIILERNKTYTGQVSQNPGLPEIEFQVIPDESTALNLFEQGRLDILTRIPGIDLERMKKKGVVVTHPFLATYYLSFNLKKTPFQQREWRRAVAGVIQKSEITLLLASGDQPAWSWIPWKMEGAVPSRDAAQVFAKSIQWMKSLPKEAKKQPVVLGFDSGARNAKVMEKIQQDLSQELGLTVSLNHSDWKSYLKILKTDAPALYRYGRMTPVLDSLPFLQSFTSQDPNNFSNFSDAHFDRLVQEIEVMDPSPERLKKIHEAQNILLEQEAVVIPIFHYVQNLAVSPRVQGFQINQFGLISWSSLNLNH